ncbi:MAG: homocysteine S-methyltransferase family protein, partial [Candidatus Krumholzibacteria bacterium]|nr:homocysteine S-methyltransferase family protein [Candidatus Krumholzibacteria bacterium]
MKKLSEGPLLLDGGMAAALSARGFPQSRPPELACLESPELLKEVHTGFRDSGSDVFLTNSFGGNEFRLEKHSLGSNQEEILLSSARIAREVAGSGVLVAGSMGPSGREDLSLQVLEAAFARQAEFLAKGGVDFFFIETMQNPEEAAAAVRGAERSGLEVCVSMCFPSGIPDDSLLAELVQRMEDTGAVAMGANCSPSSHGMPDL